ncbi:MAG: histidinol dehydrogenase [Alteromonadaceae bacterium]|nr:histidinol dehydrogenase [Alteromonadaceae bacterium]
MRVWTDLSVNEQRDALSRPVSENSQAVTTAVTEVLSQVAENGDTALLALTEKFDSVTLASLTLDSTKLNELADSLEDKVKRAIDKAYDNIYGFHDAQQPTDRYVETSPGVNCELRYTPIEAVGLYIPGGTAPLPSTVLMVGIPAKVAKCARRVLCTPPNSNGEIHPAIAYAAVKCDINEVYLVGGSQAIAAMAIGTESIAKVDKIFGPGNAYVTEAKQQVSQLPGGPAIDMPAGPSEVLVIADANANASFVAADLLSQAEHGVDSQAILVSESEQLITDTKRAVELQLAQLSRSDIAAKAMQNARYILTQSIEQSIQVSNQYAPEHLIVQVDNSRRYLADIKNAGSIFLGAWSPESAGDYASGTNHVLPTYGYARNYSSLGLSDFYRRYTVQELSYEGLKDIGTAIMDLADAEGLDAHRNAVAIRLKDNSDD